MILVLHLIILLQSWKTLFLLAHKLTYPLNIMSLIITIVHTLYQTVMDLYYMPITRIKEPFPIFSLLIPIPHKSPSHPHQPVLSYGFIPQDPFSHHSGEEGRGEGEDCLAWVIGSRTQYLQGWGMVSNTVFVKMVEAEGGMIFCRLIYSQRFNGTVFSQSFHKSSRGNHSGRPQEYRPLYSLDKVWLREARTMEDYF